MLQYRFPAQHLQDQLIQVTIAKMRRRKRNRKNCSITL